MSLDAKMVPPAFRPLIPYAEIWGVKDDVDRGHLVENAPPAARTDLLAPGGEFDARLDMWLAGPESYLGSSTAEYLAFSNMRMAYDYLSVMT